MNLLKMIIESSELKGIIQIYWSDWVWFVTWVRNGIERTRMGWRWGHFDRTRHTSPIPIEIYFKFHSSIPSIHSTRLVLLFSFSSVVISPSLVLFHYVIVIFIITKSKSLTGTRLWPSNWLICCRNMWCNVDVKTLQLFVGFKRHLICRLVFIYE